MEKTYWGLDGERPVTMPVLAKASGYKYASLRAFVHRDCDPLPCVFVGVKRPVAKIRPRVFAEFIEREEHRDKGRRMYA